MHALPVTLLMAPRRGTLCPKVSAALRGNTQWLGAPIWQRRDAVPSSHSPALIRLVERGVFSHCRSERKLHYLCLIILFTGILRQLIALLACLWQLPSCFFLSAAKTSCCLQQFLPKELSGPCVPLSPLCYTAREAGRQMPPDIEQCFGYVFETFRCQWGTRSWSQGGKGENRHRERGRDPSKALRERKEQRPRLTSQRKTKGVV